jgi:hypothetical protein
MHVLSVPVSAVCIADVLSEISTQKAMRLAHRKNTVEKYIRLLRAGARIKCSPIRVRQNREGYLEALDRSSLFVNSYVIACYLTGYPVEIKSRKPLRHAPWFRSERDGTVLPACAVSCVAKD